MTDRTDWEKGWLFASELEGGQVAAHIGEDYVEGVLKGIEELEKNLNSYEGSNQNSTILGGLIAEDWHADTFNIRAIATNSDARAFTEKSTEHASADIRTNFGNDYSLKYYKSGDKSAIQQAKNVIQNYHEYFSAAKARGTESPLSFDEYIKAHGYTDNLEDLLQSVYRGQERIIPSDQLDDGIRKLKQLIASEQARGGDHRLLNLKNYQETLEHLSDRIKDGNGIESVPLTKEESKAIAELCKRGDFKPEDFGINLETIVTSEYILQQSLSAGMTAAIVTFAIQSVPYMIKALDELIENGQIDVKSLRESGLNALSGGAKGFAIGSMSCGLFISCKAGLLGETLKSIQPGTMGTIVALSFNVAAESFAYAKGSLEIVEYKNRIFKSVIVSASALSGGVIATALFPQLNALAFAIGSMAGSVAASLFLNVTDEAVVSFCADTGYTLFGLVEQDYKLPEEVLIKRGLNLKQINRISPKKVELTKTKINTLTLSKKKINKLDVRVLRRGVISFHKIGYIL